MVLLPSSRAQKGAPLGQFVSAPSGFFLLYLLKSSPQSQLLVSSGQSSEFLSSWWYLILSASSVMGLFFFFSYTLWGNHFNEIVGWKGNKYLCYSSIWTKEHLFLKCTNNNNNNNSPSPFLYLYPNLPNRNLQRWGLRMQFLKAPWVILRHSQSWEPLC